MSASQPSQCKEISEHEEERLTGALKLFCTSLIPVPSFTEGEQLVLDKLDKSNNFSGWDLFVKGTL